MKSLSVTILFLCSCAAFAQGQNVDADSLLADADQLIQSYQFSKALALLDVMDDSLSVDVLRRKGNCYQHMGNYTDAIVQYENLIDRDSTNTNAMVALGQLYGRNKQFKESFICYNKLIAMDSLNSFYYKQYGMMAAQADASLMAISNFFRAIELNPGDIESYSFLADILIEGGEYHVADSLLRSALTINTSPQLTLLLARAMLGERKYEDVIKITGELISQRDTIPAYARLMAISCFHLEKYEEGIGWMTYLLENNYKTEWVYYYAGISYQNLGKPDSAIVYLNKAVEEGISENIADYYIQLASSYESVKDFKSAIKYYKAAYQKSGKDILLYHLAYNYDVYYKDKGPAINYFKRYLESDDTMKLAREYSKQRLNELEFYR